jgi:hypothetical protein
MDFLDPQKQRAHMHRLIIGYVLIGIGILTATTILLYQAHGFGLGKHGEVVQSGFVFVSSQPQGSQIYIDNKLYKNTTSTRLQLPEAKYTIRVQRPGYRSWQRQIDAVGGAVARFDYPLLIPTDLTAVPVRNYATLPAFSTQSPDRRWQLVQQSGSVIGFDMYDLGNSKKISDNTTTFSLPTNIVTSAGTGDHSWKLTEWSTDNQHVILEHDYTGGSEYILIDRTAPEKSINLTKTLDLPAGSVLSLRDKKFDKYYIFDPGAKTVTTATINEPAPIPVLTGVLAFKSYGSDMMLYATDAGASAGKVMTLLKDGDITYKIREIGTGAPYLLDLAQYSGDWYIAVGASIDNKEYVFKNPQAVRKTGKVVNLVPVQILRVTAPNYLAFSSNTRFIMIENGTSFSVYDAETDKGYTYAISAPLDAPQPHAAWMDGHRITYVSGGKVVFVDYDNLNFQTLVPAAPGLIPAFDRDYRNLYTLTPPAAATGQSIFTATSLLTAKDQ